MHRKRQSIEKHEETQHHSRYYFWIKKLWMTLLPRCSLTSTCSRGQTLLPHSHSFSTLPEEGNSRYQSLWKHQRKPDKDSNSTLGAGGKRREEMLALLIPQDSKAPRRKSAEIHEELRNPSPCKQNQATHWLVSSSGSERDQALSCQPSHRSGAGSGCQVGCPPCHGRPQPVQFWLLVESGLHSRGLFNLQSTVHGAFLDPTFQRAGTTLSFLLLHS